MTRASLIPQEYRAKELDLVRLKREAKKQGGFYVEPEAKLAFVVRIRCASRGSAFGPRRALLVKNS